MYNLQASELYDDEKQEEYARQAGVQKILSVLQESPSA
jgi:hypothetical protein